MDVTQVILDGFKFEENRNRHLASLYPVESSQCEILHMIADFAGNMAGFIENDAVPCYIAEPVEEEPTAPLFEVVDTGDLL